MKLVKRQIEEVRSYKGNPRKNAAAVQYVERSITEFGYLVPIVIDAQNVIVAGDTRYKALVKQGYTEIDCILADDLTPEQIKAFRLADNKVAEFAKWDNSLLEHELAELYDAVNIDMTAFGFDLLAEAPTDIDPEHPFATELREEHNYVVLYFTNDVDWLQALTLLGLGTVQTLSSRKDGSINPKMAHTGLGRVVSGPEAIQKIQEASP